MYEYHCNKCGHCYYGKGERKPCPECGHENEGIFID